MSLKLYTNDSFQSQQHIREMLLDTLIECAEEVYASRMANDDPDSEDAFWAKHAERALAWYREVILFPNRFRIIPLGGVVRTLADIEIRRISDEVS